LRIERASIADADFDGLHSHGSGEEEVKMSFSIGVTCIAVDAQSPSAPLEKADEQCILSKKTATIPDPRRTSGRCPARLCDLGAYMPNKSIFGRISSNRSSPGLPEGRIRVAPLDTYLQRSRIIPAVRSPEHIPAARLAPGAIVYLLTGDVTSIGGLVGDLLECGKLICVNIDLLGGLSSDGAAVDFIVKTGAAGIISTHVQTLKAARSRDLFAIQRTFMLDSQAVANTARSLERFSPDAIEILPAMVAPRTFPRLRAVRADLPIIAGGLVADLLEIDRLVAAGVDAVSASEPGLWGA
jgi:glycerol uptake operon antiterminator